MKLISWVLTLCIVLSCTHAVRVQRAVLQSPSSSVSSSTCTSESIRVNGRCYPRPTVSQQEIANESESLGRALAEAIEQAQNGRNVTSIAATFSQVLTRIYSRIVGNSVLAVMDPENEDICRYTGQAAAAFASAMGQVVARSFASSENQYARAGAQCLANVVASTSFNALQRSFYGECSNFGAEFVYNRLNTVGFIATITRHVSNLLNAIATDNAFLAVASCNGERSSNSDVTTITSG